MPAENVHDQRPIVSYLVNCRARNLSPRTIDRYEELLIEFAQYIGRDLLDVRADDIRLFITHLQDNGHNPAGVWTYYRTLKTFYRWLFSEELFPLDIFKKIKAPHVPEKILSPVELVDVGKLLKTCVGQSFIDKRDRAIILSLLDTGLRAAEFIAIQQNDLDLTTGAIVVREGKGRKRRTVFISSKTRQAVSKYLRIVKTNDYVWQAENGAPIKYAGLRQIIRRRAEQARIVTPALHSFRRAFAINSLRNGMDIISLQRLLGHSNLDVINSYLYQMPDDLGNAHAKFGPVK